MVLHIGKACLLQQCAHGLALVEAVFEQQPAIGFEMRRRTASDLTDRIEAIVAGGERGWRFVAQVAAVRCASPAAM